MSALQALDVPAGGWRGTLNSVPVNTSAWGEKNWADLRRAGSRKRRQNVILDGAAGERGYPGDVDIAGPVDLYWVVIGSHDQDGVAYADPEEGLDLNLTYLHGLWFGGDEDERGTVEATIVSPGGRLFVARVQVDEFAATGGWQDCELRVAVTLPSGPALAIDEESA